ncbi:plastocyanin/azurin family copper-binding protein [Streptomyces spiramyceticus]|uniref:plastocyanin/azurin family copper-binding protein n=1 Tax=Streptomyces spiramyceticus TaxID=299717 RepID=UPI00237B3B0A|nr:plastocyanin/azurin family copper-binding protein [Streptomyces spiramyceticus]
MAKTLTRSRVGLGLAAGALAGVLAGCGGGNGDDASTPAPPPERNTEPGVTRVNADMTDFRIALSEKTFKAGDYSFVAKNNGKHDHALEIEGPSGEHSTKVLAPGESETLKVTLKSGTHEVYCPVGGHKDLGMKTEITVGGGDSPVNETPPKTNGY